MIINTKLILLIKSLLNINGNNYVNQFLEELYISNFYIENKSYIELCSPQQLLGKSLKFVRFVF